MFRFQALSTGLPVCPSCPPTRILLSAKILSLMQILLQLENFTLRKQSFKNETCKALRSNVLAHKKQQLLIRLGTPTEKVLFEQRLKR